MTNTETTTTSRRGRRAQQAKDTTALTPVKPVNVFSDGTRNDDGALISLTKDDAIAFYSDELTEEIGGSHGLQHEQIWAIINAIAGDETDNNLGESIYNSRLDALKKQIDRKTLEDLTVPPTAIKSATHTLAVEYGKLIDKEADKMLEVAVDGQETYEGKPLELAPVLCKLWGGTVTESDERYSLHCDAVDAMPIPNSSEEEVPQETSNARKVDRYKWFDHNNQKKRNGWFVGEMVDCTVVGADLRQRIFELELVGVQGFDEKQIRPEYKTDDFKNDVAGVRTATLARLKKRRTSRCSRVAKAIAFMQVCNRINSEFPKVLWGFTVPHFKWEKISDAAVLNKCIRLSPATGGQNVGSPLTMSLSTFNNLQLAAEHLNGRVKLDVAKEKGATLAAIRSVLTRPRQDADKLGANKMGGDEGKSGKFQGIPTIEQIESFFNMFASGLEKRGNKDAADAYRAKITLWLNEATSDGDERLMTMSEVRDKLIDILAPFQQRINAIVAKQVEETNRAIAAKQNKTN